MHIFSDANWGSSTQAQIFTTALNSVYSLVNIEEHIKTYRPQVLVLSGPPSYRPPLVHFANCITKNMSLLVTGHLAMVCLIKKYLCISISILISRIFSVTRHYHHYSSFIWMNLFFESVCPLEIYREMF